MSFFDSIPSFIDGIKSVIDISGVIQSTISNSISTGIEVSFDKIKKSLEYSLMKCSLLFLSLILIVWGLSLFLDNFVPYHGLGFVIIGSLFGIIVVIFVKEKKSCNS